MLVERVGMVGAEMLVAARREPCKNADRRSPAAQAAIGTPQVISSSASEQRLAGNRLDLASKSCGR